MVILVDTNIILDVLQKREPFYTDSKDIHHFTTFNSGIPLNEVHILGALL